MLQGIFQRVPKDLALLRRHTKGLDNVLSRGTGVGDQMRDKMERNPGAQLQPAQPQRAVMHIGFYLAGQRMMPMNPHGHAPEAADGHHDVPGSKIADQAARP